MAGKSCIDLEEPKIPPALIESSAVQIGGYDCDFVNAPADDLLCRICQYPARDPILTVCCGHNFCTTCLQCYLQSRSINHGSCPYCREDKFQTMPDKRTERYVLNLKVFCSYKHLGCKWVGELRSLEDHVSENSSIHTGCPFTELQCSNGCGVVMQRRLVEGHLKSECELREVKCEYCNTTGSYQWINSSHHEECPKYPVECPNHCEVGHVRREEIRGHLEECPLAIVACPYATLGCESIIRMKEEMEHVMGSVGQHMEFNKNAILDTQDKLGRIRSAINDRLDSKEREVENVKRDLKDAEKELQATRSRLFIKEQELENIKKDLQATRDRLDSKEQAMASINKDLQDTKEKLKQSQYQLKTAIIEKGRELDEVRRKAEETNNTLHEMMQQQKDKLEQSLQKQQKVNSQLQLQVETIFNAAWPLQLNYLAVSGNNIVPVVIKLKEFEKHKFCNFFQCPEFYTRDGGYKMCLIIYPNGHPTAGYITMCVYLMKGDHDDHLTWPVKGTLTVQLLNQLSDSNHSEPVEFCFNGSSTDCQRVTTGVESVSRIWCYQFISHKKLSRDAGKNCQYLKNDLVFFRVCDFQ